MEVDPLACEVHGLMSIQIDAVDAWEGWKEACSAGLNALQVVLYEGLQITEPLYSNSIHSSELRMLFKTVACLSRCDV